MQQGDFSTIPQYHIPHPNPNSNPNPSPNPNPNPNPNPSANPNPNNSDNPIPYTPAPPPFTTNYPTSDYSSHSSDIPSHTFQIQISRMEPPPPYQSSAQNQSYMLPYDHQQSSSSISQPIFTPSNPITYAAYPPFHPHPMFDGRSTGNESSAPLVDNTTPSIQKLSVKLLPDTSGGQATINVVCQTTTVAVPSELSMSDWQEHTSADGKRYYYNKKTKQSSWEKPFELMTVIERADASTVWKEFVTQDGRKYYYNKVTKQSKWTLPDELKLARENSDKAANLGSQSELSAVSALPLVATPTTLPFTSTPTMVSGIAPTFVPIIPAPTGINTSTVVLSKPMETSTPSFATEDTLVHTTAAIAPFLTNAVSGIPHGIHNPSKDVVPVINGASAQDIVEAKKGMAVAGKINITPIEEKTVDEEPLIYASKLDAKNAFKALLESANVDSDWTWDQAMRVIINDKRYGALKTLGEKKQAFNEYLGQRKKFEAEERRLRQRRAKEEFIKMLEESKELTSATRWSKAVLMFEDDERFKSVDRPRDREDLFYNYLDELQEKEKIKAREDLEHNKIEYRKFLESCDFIKVNSQWRKVQDRLEDDERCSRLEKVDRLEIFQEYIRHLERDDDEQRKVHKEQMKRVERKNRDTFFSMVEEHVASGYLTAKIHWREYCVKVKDSPQYLALASNLSGSTPKDLFDEIAEELERMYHDDRGRIKEAFRLGKVILSSASTFENFKSSILENTGSPSVSDINLKLVFDEFVDRIREKEEKDARRRQRLSDDFSALLHSIKEITSSSTWEESVQLFSDSVEFSEIEDEGLGKEVFEEYIAYLHEKAMEKERKREEEKVKREREREEKEKRKEKEKKEKLKERMKKEDEGVEEVEVEERRRKHRKRHHSNGDDVNSEEEKDTREEVKRSRRHGKKSRKHVYSPDSESEERHRKHKREHRRYEELEDGEVGEDGEIW